MCDFIPVNEKDAIELTNTIKEVEMCDILYKYAVRQEGATPIVIKAIMDYYMHCLKVHKALWRDILIKYVGLDDAAKFQNLFRFDTVKRVIFKLHVEGCQLCKE